MNDVRDLMLLDDTEKARHVENIADFKINLIDNVADQPVFAVAGKHDRAVAFSDEFARRLGADYTHATRDKNLHRFRPSFLLKHGY
jgi:hypothetical protein